MIKNIILDTDIGVDSDDAVAIALLLNLQKQKLCKINAITCSTTRRGATSSVKALLNYYGEKILVGFMSEPSLKCDEENNYALALEQKYGKVDGEFESVELIRKTLAESKEKITIISIGPLSNIARFLISEKDKYSELNGIELAKEKVAALYIMGGAFKENYDKNYKIFPEWNILQDIKSARYCANHFPCKMIYSPHEVGKYVYTYLKDIENPVYYAMREFAVSKKFEIENFKRESWDPVTVYYAIMGNKSNYELSENGKITITEDGITEFNCQIKSKHYYR